jgi:hypothetical protein
LALLALLPAVLMLRSGAENARWRFVLSLLRALDDEVAARWGCQSLRPGA